MLERIQRDLSPEIAALRRRIKQLERRPAYTNRRRVRCWTCGAIGKVKVSRKPGQRLRDRNCSTAPWLEKRGGGRPVQPCQGRLRPLNWRPRS